MSFPSIASYWKPVPDPFRVLPVPDPSRAPLERVPVSETAVVPSSNTFSALAGADMLPTADELKRSVVVAPASLSTSLKLPKATELLQALGDVHVGASYVVNVYNLSTAAVSVSTVASSGGTAGNVTAIAAGKSGVVIIQFTNVTEGSEAYLYHSM